MCIVCAVYWALVPEMLSSVSKIDLSKKLEILGRNHVSIGLRRQCFGELTVARYVTLPIVAAFLTPSFFAYCQH